MRTTLKDVARCAGCSVTTASLVLNDKGASISEETKERVYDAVKALHYRPNQLAVGLVKKQTKTIGLIISDVSNSFFATMAKGVEDECRAQGWNLILCNTNNHHKREMEYIHTLSDKECDGIILCFATEDDYGCVEETVRLMNRLDVPHVMVDRFVAEIEGYFVSVDHELGGYLAGCHLARMGHRRIGCVTGPAKLEDSQARTYGFKKALREFGLEPDEELVYEGKYDIESGERGAAYLLGKNATAIFAYNDLMAYGVYQWMKRNGRAVPADVSVVGYDDVNFSELLSPPLTSVRQPVYEMGKEAVRQMISIIKKESVKRERILFPPELTIRESVLQL